MLSICFPNLSEAFENFKMRLVKSYYNYQTEYPFSAFAGLCVCRVLPVMPVKMLALLPGLKAQPKAHPKDT
jgi:hypothetical protein